MKTAKNLLSKAAIKKGIFPTDIAFTAEEADRFLDYIIDQSVLKDSCRMVKMTKESRNVRAIGLAAGDVLKPAATFSSSDYKDSVIHNLIVLTAKKARGCAIVYDDDLEDNIEGEAFVDHLLKMIGAKIANELEYTYYMANAVPDGITPKKLLDLWNGWRYRVLNQTNDVSGPATKLDARADFTNNNGYIAELGTTPAVWEFKFSKMLKSMPSIYKTKGLANFRFFLNSQVVQDYIDALAARATILGDKAIQGEAGLQYGTVPIVPVPLMPSDLPIAVTGGGSTTVNVDSAAGQKVLKVAGVAEFTVADYIHIFKAGLEYKAEVGKIASIDAEGPSLTLESNLEWDHAASDAETVKEVTIDGTDCVFTHKENFIIGLHRDIKMETERQAADEATYFFYSIRSDIAVENLNAVVFTHGLKVK